MSRLLTHAFNFSIPPGGSNNAGAELEKESMLVKRGALNTKPRESDRVMDQEVIEFLGLSRDSKTGAIEYSKLNTPVRQGLNTGGGEGGVGRVGGAGSSLGPLATPAATSSSSVSSSSSSGALTSPTNASAAMSPLNKGMSTGTSSLTGNQTSCRSHSN